MTNYGLPDGHPALLKIEALERALVESKGAWTVGISPDPHDMAVWIDTGDFVSNATLHLKGKFPSKAAKVKWAEQLCALINGEQDAS